MLWIMIAFIFFLFDYMIIQNWKSSVVQCKTTHNLNIEPDYVQYNCFSALHNEIEQSTGSAVHSSCHWSQSKLDKV